MFAVLNFWTADILAAMCDGICWLSCNFRTIAEVVSGGGAVVLFSFNIRKMRREIARLDAEKRDNEYKLRTEVAAFRLLVHARLVEQQSGIADAPFDEDMLRGFLGSESGMLYAALEHLSKNGQAVKINPPGYWNIK